jgi:hypothetical protein
MNNKNYKNKSSEIYLDVPDTLVIKTGKKKARKNKEITLCNSDFTVHY